MAASFPTSARFVIIGGGVIGTSIAFHLARAGERDVVLLEKASLTAGATWHAAGLVGQFRSQQNLTRMMRDSVEVYDGLAEETGQDPDWHKVGSLRIATSEDRWKELLRADSAARAVGLETALVSPREARDLFPLLEIGDLIGAAFIPDDGYIDPNSLTQAYARGFRRHGGRIIEGTMVKELPRRRDRISHVVTDHGTIEVETVVNAAGLWARQVGWMAGVEIPAGVVEHQYLVTEKSDQIAPGLPALRDPDGSFYVKPEPGALAIGGWERQTRAVHAKEGLPWQFERHLFNEDLDRLAEITEPATRRLPILNDLGVRNIINGPIPISPDGEPVIGPVPGLRNFFAACAFTSGIAASGGAGKAVANWLMHGHAGLDLWPFDIRRFGPLHAGWRFLHDRAVESYGRYYAIHWPGEELETARGLRRSPLYQCLKEQGAVFGAKFGWERANWFAQANMPERAHSDFERSGEVDTVGPEHLAARENVVLIDQSSFTKFEISGRQACRFLQYLAVANVDKEPGRATYCQLCNERGGIEADVTIIRRSEDCFWLITGSGFAVRDRHWIDRNMQSFLARHRLSETGRGELDLREITSALGVLNLAGPLAREVLRKVCDEDVSHDAFPFMTAKEIRIGYASALAFRVSYLGELGWELYIPSEYLQYVYEELWQAGAAYDIRNVGYRAIDSLRLEKRYLVWGVDITPDYNPLEAGLQFLIDWNKGEFLGAAALARIKDEGARQKLVCLALDEPLPVFGDEAILLDGKAVGQSTSGNFGYSVGKSLVLAYLPTACLGERNFAVESLGKRSPASLVSGAAYDPKREKILR